MTITSSNGQTLKLDSSDLNTIKSTMGVYPLGCSRCADYGDDGSRIGLAPNFKGDGVNTQDCPGVNQPDSRMPVGSCKGGKEHTPSPNACQITQPISDSYTVSFSPKN